MCVCVVVCFGLFIWVSLCVWAVVPARCGALVGRVVERGILWDGLYDASVVGHMTDSPQSHACAAYTVDVAGEKHTQLAMFHCVSEIQCPSLGCGLRSAHLPGRCR